jgi:hypothetical protein
MMSVLAVVKEKICAEVGQISTSYWQEVVGEADKDAQINYYKVKTETTKNET